MSERLGPLLGKLEKAKFTGELHLRFEAGRIPTYQYQNQIPTYGILGLAGVGLDLLHGFLESTDLANNYHRGV